MVQLICTNIIMVIINMTDILEVIYCGLFSKYECAAYCMYFNIEVLVFFLLVFSWAQIQFEDIGKIGYLDVNQ